MLETLIPIGITLIQQLLGSGSILASPVVKYAVEFITTVTPVVIQEYKDLKPIVKNIITALKADPSTLPTQLEELEKAEVLIDAAFEEAAAKAIAEDDATD